MITPLLKIYFHWLNLAAILLICILSFRFAEAKDCLELATRSPLVCLRNPKNCTPSETLGLFTSCHKQYLQSCLHLVKAITQEKHDTPLSVLVDEFLFFDQEFCDQARALKNQVNLILVKEPAKYMRDPGFFSSQGIYSALPYGIMGAQSVATFFAQCPGIKVEQALKGENLVNNKNLYEDNLDPQTFELRADGGNILFLNPSTVLVGETHARPFPKQIEEYLKQNKKVIKIKVPNLQVGHLDEIFFINPNRQQCEILVASPQQMKTFLTQNKNLELYPEPLSPEQRAQLEIAFDQIQIRNSSKRPLPLEWKSKFESKKMITADQVLANKILMAQWTLWQNQIDAAKLKIKQAARCAVHFRDLPVFWNLKGQAILTNPVNSIYLNKKYLISKPYLISKVTYEFKNQIEGRISTMPFLIYEKAIQSQLGLVKFVDLKDYDEGGGNVHCATQQILCTH